MDPRRGEELATTCAEMTITMGSSNRSLRVRQVAGIDGDGYATIATTKVDEHVVVVVSHTLGGVLEESEFVRVVDAANERVRVEL